MQSLICKIDPLQSGSRFWIYEKLVEIEQFVKDVLSGKCQKSPCFDKSKKMTYLRGRLDQCYISVLKRIFVFDMHDLYDYRNPYVRIFLRACNDLSAPDSFHLWLLSSGMSGQEVMNKLIDQICELAKSDFFRSKLFEHANWPQHSLATAVSYVEGLFQTCSRYTVLRLDLSYRACVVDLIGIEEAKKDLEQFLRRKREGRPSVLKKMAGYVWRMDFGVDAGFHFHLLLFFKNVHGARAAYWGNELGGYWRDVITGGRGRFDNCNARQYVRNGIGEVNRFDTEKLNILLTDVLGYLFKGSQRIPVHRSDRSFRSFGMGEA